ncbi:unnamed protein product, partial [Urochloa humidicola]
EFVDEVLKTVELDDIKDALVGRPGINGLSLEQRKRLTVAVELVSNPSIILMDEPTTGLDARSAAIVIRAVKNISETGRIVVCTIHQPSTEIFEAFDELILMKNGGKIVYNGPIGEQSCKVIEYFEKISGCPKNREKLQPCYLDDGRNISIHGVSTQYRLCMRLPRITIAQGHARACWAREGIPPESSAVNQFEYGY